MKNAVPRPKDQLEKIGTDATYFENADNLLPDTYKVTVVNMEDFDKTAKTCALNG